MGARRTKAERAMQSLHDRPVQQRPAWDRTANEVLYGRQDDGNPVPSPHPHLRVSLGDDVHRTRYAPEPRAPSVAEQIDAMLQKHRR